MHPISLFSRMCEDTHSPDGRPGPPGRRSRDIVAGLATRFLRLVTPVAILLGVATPAAWAETITGARYIGPVERYGHFALGRPHEYARVSATTDAGRTLALQLPDNEVFEDLAPRLVSLAAGEPAQLLAIVSRREGGARLALIRLAGDRLELAEQSPAIGTPMRWLNPVAVADLDGDGQAEITAVITPHIGGTLKAYRRVGGKLVEIASLAGFSNHVYGSSQLAMSASLELGGRMHLVVPDARRLHLRVVALEDGRLKEVRRCALAEVLTGAVRVTAPSELVVGLGTGPKVVALRDCAVSLGWSGSGGIMRVRAPDPLGQIPGRKDGGAVRAGRPVALSR